MTDAVTTSDAEQYIGEEPEKPTVDVLLARLVDGNEKLHFLVAELHEKLDRLLEPGQPAGQGQVELRA